MKHPKEKTSSSRGFTLVEMLVVIAIIAILVAIIIPTVTSATKRANAATDAANLRSAIAEANIYIASNGAPEDAVGDSGHWFATTEVPDVGTKSKSGDGWLAVCYYSDDRGVDAHFFNTDTDKKTYLKDYLEILGE
jgi:prepilin-type N-terminal cleavage/methylation domain-containing protein